MSFQFSADTILFSVQKQLREKQSELDSNRAGLNTTERCLQEGTCPGANSQLFVSRIANLQPQVDSLKTQVELLINEISVRANQEIKTQNVPIIQPAPTVLLPVLAVSNIPTSITESIEPVITQISETLNLPGGQNNNLLIGALAIGALLFIL